MVSLCIHDPMDAIPFLNLSREHFGACKKHCCKFQGNFSQENVSYKSLYTRLQLMWSLSWASGGRRLSFLFFVCFVFQIFFGLALSLKLQIELGLGKWSLAEFVTEVDLLGPLRSAPWRLTWPCCISKKLRATWLCYWRKNRPAISISANESLIGCVPFMWLADWLAFFSMRPADWLCQETDKLTSDWSRHCLGSNQ